MFSSKAASDQTHSQGRDAGEDRIGGRLGDDTDVGMVGQYVRNHITGLCITTYISPVTGPAVV